MCTACAWVLVVYPSSEPSSGASTGPRWGRLLLLMGMLICLYLLGRQVAEMIVHQFGFHLWPSTELVMHRLIMTATLFYIVLMAIPFMPAMEIGLTMILFFGPQICFLIYTSTVLALCLSYLAGRIIPSSIWARCFAFFGMTRAKSLMDRLMPLSADERLLFLIQSAPNRIAPVLLRHRFLALAVVLNLPGNMLVGGGGGIGLIAGITGLFPAWRYLLAVAVAVAPVPLIVALTG